MSASPSPALKTPVQQHVHFDGQNCPYCDQPIPEDRLEEVSGRIEARARERISEETARLREQHARDRAQAELKAKAELDQAKKDAIARENIVRQEATAAAEDRLREQLAAAEGAKTEAEVARAGLAQQLEAAHAHMAETVARMNRDAASRETTIREEATKTAEAGAAEKIAAAEKAKADAERGRVAAEAALNQKSAERAQEIEALKEAHAGEINAQRDALAKDKVAAVNTERANALNARMKLEAQLGDMQRKLQEKTAYQHGEGAELDLHDVLKTAFPDDHVRRVPKGALGADVIHEIVDGGKVVGKIVYDSKNRGNWASDYAVKLRKDQIAEKAEFAILSTNKFPKDKRELCTFEDVIIACPARVLALAEILRARIIEYHELRVGSVERESKMAELYTFINSPLAGQLLGAVESLVGKMDQLDVDEQNAHRKVWDKRAILRQSILKSNGDFRSRIRRIVGTIDDPDTGAAK